MHRYLKHMSQAQVGLPTANCVHYRRYVSLVDLTFKYLESGTTVTVGLSEPFAGLTLMYLHFG